MKIKTEFVPYGFLEESLQMLVDEGWTIVAVTWQETLMTPEKKKGHYVVVLSKSK